MLLLSKIVSSLINKYKMIVKIICIIKITTYYGTIMFEIQNINHDDNINQITLKNRSFKQANSQSCAFPKCVFGDMEEKKNLSDL